MTSPVFLKWAGGKRRILPLIEPYFPKKFETYYEPFLGGGSVFFHIKRTKNPKLCVLSDTNKDLIQTYKHVRDKPDEIIRHLKQLKSKHSKEFYYQTRRRFNEQKFGSVKRSAVFIYLNKTCFNGLYRVNSRNEFNVPFGSFENPGIYDEETIYMASTLLKDRVKILHQDYRAALKTAKERDFVYLDPCYDPLKKTSFAHYTPQRFQPKDRIDLFNCIENLRLRGVNVVLSNNDVAEVRDLYSFKKYQVHTITAPRFIGSKANYRENVEELVISTF